jgi:hypothetical protein
LLFFDTFAPIALFFRYIVTLFTITHC